MIRQYLVDFFNIETCISKLGLELLSKLAAKRDEASAFSVAQLGNVRIPFRDRRDRSLNFELVYSGMFCHLSRHWYHGKQSAAALLLHNI